MIKYDVKLEGEVKNNGWNFLGINFNYKSSKNTIK